MDEIIRANWHWLILIGVFGGTMSGALGVGSGIIIVPALVLGMSFPQKTAQGMCLAVMTPMVLMGAIRYKMNPAVQMNMQVVALLAVCAVIGAFVGVEIAGRLPSNVLRKAFACLIIIAALRMLFVPASRKPADNSGGQHSAATQTTSENEKGKPIGGSRN